MKNSLILSYYNLQSFCMKVGGNNIEIGVIFERQASSNSCCL